MMAPASPRTVLYVHSSAGRYGADRQLGLLVANLDPERYGALVALLSNVWRVREIYADFERWWPAYRRVLMRADAVACLSAATRAQFGDVPNARVIHEGLPAEAASRRPRSRREARRALDLPD